MLGAVAASVRVVFAGTSSVNAPLLSAVACSPEDRTDTVAPATAIPRVSTIRPVTVARSLATVGVSGAVSGGASTAQPTSEATTTNPAM